ncbi:MAG: 30S ribosomal protein S17 [Candidatus Saganbacteria bacterium]|nr:30S ribosomal protein S17 [Candidatus Saganbacteria bacterium]
MRKLKEGFVLKNKMDKTVIVGVEQRFKHPLYQKVVSKTSRFVCHDEENKCNVGDKVSITETRPLSKTKRWRVETVIEQERTGKGHDTSTN